MRTDRYESWLIGQIDARRSPRKPRVYVPVENVRVIRSASDVDFNSMTIKSFAATFDFGAAVRRAMVQV